jgi:secreted trypsin-like serine protease
MRSLIMASRLSRWCLAAGLLAVGTLWPLLLRAQTPEPSFRELVRQRLQQRQAAFSPKPRPSKLAKVRPLFADSFALSKLVSSEDLLRGVGGGIAADSDHPFQVGLLQASLSDPHAALFCGGSLLNQRFVLTAAHCSDDFPATSVQVLSGTRRLDGSGVRRNVRRIVLHPLWDSQTFDYDVAIWELDQPVADVAGAAFASADDDAKAEQSQALMMATGWGALGPDGDVPVDLQKITIPYVQREQCNDWDSYRGAITPRMLCAGLDQGGVDTCKGDSGGPLTLANHLIGIISWGADSCGMANYYGVYTRLSDLQIRQFIDSTLLTLSAPR